MATQFRHFEVEPVENVVIVKLTSFELLDRLVTNELQDELVQFLEVQQPPRVVISFVQVRRCSTETINALLRGRKRVVGYGGQMSLCDMQAKIREVFRLLNLEGTVFQIHDTVADALNAF